MKAKKSYEELSKEGEARAQALFARFEASPYRDQARAEVAAENAVAAAMAKARKEAGLTQAQVAERMGVAQSNVSRMLRGRVTVTNLFRYLAACGKTAELTLRQL